jgi:hypothetical protein
VFVDVNNVTIIGGIDVTRLAASQREREIDAAGHTVSKAGCRQPQRPPALEHTNIFAGSELSDIGPYATSYSCLISAMLM